MSVDTLIAGRLATIPETRPTRNGGKFTFFKLKVVNGANLEYWDVTTFSDTAREELEGLGVGDALSAVGGLHVEQYEHRGEKRIALKLTADRVLALKPKPNEAKPKSDKPRAGAAKSDPRAAYPHLQAGGGRDHDDAIPF